MGNFVSYYLVCLEELEIEILKSLEGDDPEFVEANNELIALKESYLELE